MDNTAGVPKLMSLHLLEEITDGFSEKRKLGGGAYGDVYLGEHKDGVKIAVKVLKDVLDLEDEKFEKEYRNLAILEHKNVVRLVASCNETKEEYVPHNGIMVKAIRARRMLCFEYMCNGSLENFIYDESNACNWHTRYAIIKGICDGLEYLHEKLKPDPMFHLDLKPANVLLDENMSPKIADFGVSRLFLEEKTRKTNSNLGTLGYIPPEYINGGLISTKFDIFSLGVLIIKIMMGQEAYFTIDEMSSQEFADLVHMNWMSRLQGPHAYSIQTRRCIEIALSCVEKDRRKRPSIGAIASNLNQTEYGIQIFEALKNGLDHQLCPCICNENRMLHILESKSISYPLHVTDNRGRVHEATITTAGNTSTFQPVKPRIKIIDCTEGSGSITAIDTHSTEPWILVGYYNGNVSIWNHHNQIWNMDSPTPIASFDCSPEVASALDYFCPGGALQYLVARTAVKGSAQIWDLQSNTCIKLINGLQKYSCNIAVVEGPSGRPILLTVSEDGTVAFCDLITHRYENRVNFKLGDVWGFAYITMTKSLAVLCDDGIALMELE